MNNQNHPQNKGNWLFKAPKQERLNDHEKTVIQGVLGQVDGGYARLFDRYSHMAPSSVQVAANMSVADQVSVQPDPEAKLTNVSPAYKYNYKAQSQAASVHEDNETALQAAREKVAGSYSDNFAGQFKEMVDA